MKTGASALSCTACALFGCGATVIEPSTPDPLLWTSTPTDLGVLFRQQGGNATVLNSQVEKCRAAFSSQWQTIESALAGVHADLVDKKKSTGSIAWAGIAPTPWHKVYLADTKTGTHNSLGLASIGSTSGASDVHTVDLLIATVDYKTSLTKDAEECVQQSICASDPTGGTYFDAAYYGVFVQLHMKDIDVRQDANGRVSSVSFSGGFSTNSVNITAVVAGDIRTPDGLKSVYDIPEIVDDIKARHVLEIGEKLRARTSRLALVAVDEKRVGPTDCKPVANPGR